MSKSTLDSTSLKNSTTLGVQKCAINFENSKMSFQGATSSDKCLLSNIADGVNNSDAVTLSQLNTKFQELQTGMSWIDSCSVKAENNIAGTYTGKQTITGSTPGALADIDGVTPTQDMRVLLAGQTDKKQNGIYKVTRVGDASTTFKLDRADDVNSAESLTSATTVVLLGTKFASVVYLQKNILTDLDSDIEWVQVSNSVSEFDVTDGLFKVGATVKIGTSGALSIISDKVTVSPGGITNAELAPDSVQQSNLSDSSVGTPQLQPLCVENGNLSGQIEGSKLKNQTLTEDKYGIQSIGSSSYKLRSIQSNAIGLDAILSENINTGAVDGDALANNAVDGSIHIAPSSLVTANYSTNSITDDALAPNSVGSLQLKSNSVLTSSIANGQITTGKLDNTVNSEAVDSSVIRSGAVTADKIALSSIDAETKVIDGSITNAKLKDGSITSNKFGTLTSLDVSGTVSANAIVLGGSASGSGTYALCKQVFNHIDVVEKYNFTNSFKRIMDNEVIFPYESQTIAVSAIARLIFQSETASLANLQFVLGVRFWADPTTPENHTVPVSFDSQQNNWGNTNPHQLVLQGFASDGVVGSNKRIYSVSWWAKESTGNGLIIPAGYDFISQVLIVNDSSNAQRQQWSSGNLTNV